MRVASFALLLFLWGALPARAVDSVQEAARRDTFVVQAMVGDTRAQIGSGVVVGRVGDVLTVATAAHLIRPNLPLRILDESRRAYYEVLDVQTVPGYDLALIRVRAQPGFPVQAAQFGSGSPGDPVWLWGNPSAGFWTLSSATVVATAAQLPGATTPRITIDCASCTFGDSGSGVFTADGKLIGILSSGWRDPKGRLVLVEVEPVTPIAGALLAQRDPIDKAQLK